VGNEFVAMRLDLIFDISLESPTLYSLVEAMARPSFAPEAAISEPQFPIFHRYDSFFADSTAKSSTSSCTTYYESTHKFLKLR
jgi:hypothetical protein